MTSMHLPAQDTWTSSSPTTDSLTRYTQTDTHRYTLMNRHIHTNTHLTNTYMHTSVIQHTSTHTLIHTHGQAHTIKHTPHLHTPTLTHSICLACLFPMLTLQHLMSAASIFRSCSHVGLSGPIIHYQVAHLFFRSPPPGSGFTSHNLKPCLPAGFRDIYI